MIDREKVIKEYEEFVDKYECFCSSDDYVLEMHKAVLALLKEQEAVEPKSHPAKAWTRAKTLWFCGACGARISKRKTKFCQECGKKVKWNE